MSGFGRHAYNIPDPADQFADQHPASKEEAALDKLDAAGILRVVKRAAATEQQRAAADQFQQDQKTFRKLYPAYRDTDRNAVQMQNYWQSALGVEIPTIEEMEESYFALRNRGLLELDQKAVAREDEEATLRRAAELRERREALAFNEADAYTLPLEELERRARKEAKEPGW